MIMLSKNFVFLIGLLTGSGACAASKIHLDEMDLQNFIPKGHQVLLEKHSDFNSDGKPEIILITEDLNKPDDTRLLQIMKNDGGGNYTVFRNSELIPCSVCGGRSGEPTFRYIKSTRKGFELQIYVGGIRHGRLKTLDFEYVPRKKNWFLRKEVKITFDDLDPGHADTQKRAYSRGGFKIDFESAEDRNLRVRY